MHFRDDFFFVSTLIIILSFGLCKWFCRVLLFVSNFGDLKKSRRTYMEHEHNDDKN